GFEGAFSAGPGSVGQRHDSNVDGVQIGDFSFEAEGQGLKVIQVQAVFWATKEAKADSARIRLRQALHCRLDSRKVRNCRTAAYPTHSDRLPLFILQTRWHWLAPVLLAVDDRGHDAHAGIELAGIIGEEPVAGDDMQAVAQDCIHSAAVLEPVEQRVIESRDIAVAGVDGVVEAEDDAGVPAHDPLLEQRGEKRKSLAVDDDQVELRKIREPKETVCRTTQGLEHFGAPPSFRPQELEEPSR